MATTCRSPPTSSSAKESCTGKGSVGSKQAEMMKRLEQLMAWQERQKASLLKQQQEEIVWLCQQHQVIGEEVEQSRSLTVMLIL